jgi:hypothetical protein
VRIDLPSKQSDGSSNWVELREIDDLLAADLFAIHRAVRISTGEGGQTTYAPREMEDDSANAFLSQTITAWSFPVPVPRDAASVAAGDVVIGRAMKARDWSVLRKKIKPLMDELEGLDQEDPKEQTGVS